MNAITLENLNHTYPSSRKTGNPNPVLSHLNFNVAQGEIFGLLGPNGGGKTTLFRILTTLLKPSFGRAKIFGFDVVNEAAAVRNKIGIVFQNPSLDKKLTLAENLKHQGHLYGLSGKSLQKRCDAVLEKLNIASRKDDFVEHLSGGLQRRGEIAKCLLHNPELLLMDEPSTGLDPGARRDLWSHLLELNKSGVSILLTTHLMEEAEKCQRVGILHKGELVALGTPEDLKSQIGGDVITIQTKDAEGLCKKIKGHFSGNPTFIENTVRIEIAKGHQFIPKIVETFPGYIQSITVGKPQLEDVFVHVTGQRFIADV